MSNEELIKIALSEAGKVFPAAKSSGREFNLKGYIREWDSAVNKNVFEIALNVFAPFADFNVELDMDSGNILNSEEKKL